VGEGADIGTTVAGRYRLESKLGAGGMGIVYLATRLVDGEPVVIKTLLESWALNPVAKRRFALEARAASSLVHPGIVRILDFIDDGQVPMLVMEHLVGRTLSEVIREPPMMSAERAVDLSRQILDALAAAHAHGIVHRDLKPANIMVVAGEDGRERIKILDFGLARIFDDERRTRLTSTGQILGTPGFLAPEQAKGDPIDPRTDLFSLGVLMYVMLAERLPFEGGDAVARMMAMLTEAPTPITNHRPDIPDGLVSVVWRCLEKRPEDRYDSAASVSHALALALAPSNGKFTAATMPARRLAPPRPSSPVPATPGYDAGAGHPTNLRPDFVVEPGPSQTRGSGGATVGRSAEAPSKSRNVVLLALLAAAGGLVLVVAVVGAAAFSWGRPPPSDEVETATDLDVPLDVVVPVSPRVAAWGPVIPAEDKPPAPGAAEASSPEEPSPGTAVGEAPDRPEANSGDPPPVEVSSPGDEAPGLSLRNIAFGTGIPDAKATEWADDQLEVLAPCFEDVERNPRRSFLLRVGFDPVSGRANTVRIVVFGSRRAEACVERALLGRPGHPGAEVQVFIQWR